MIERSQVWCVGTGVVGVSRAQRWVRAVEDHRFRMQSTPRRPKVARPHEGGARGGEGAIHLREAHLLELSQPFHVVWVGRAVMLASGAAVLGCEGALPQQ